MRITLILLIIMTSLCSCSAQHFNSYLDSIPTINYPKTFNESSYYNWKGYELPVTIRDLEEFSNYETIGKLSLDQNYTLLLVRKYYNNGYDRFIYLVSFDTQGNYLSDLEVEYTADGEGGEFSITPENKIRVADYGASQATILTYRYENGNFIQDGNPEYGDADNLPDY